MKESMKNDEKDFCPLIKDQCIETYCAMFNFENDDACAFVSIATSLRDAANTLKEKTIDA